MTPPHFHIIYVQYVYLTLIPTFGIMLALARFYNTNWRVPYLLKYLGIHTSFFCRIVVVLTDAIS
jgi:hypothetical protein